MRIVLAALATFAVSCGGCTKQDAAAEPGSGGGSSAGGKPRVGFVTNCVAGFWTIGARGVEAGAREFGLDATVHMPPDGTVEQQKRFLEDLLTRGAQGIALSPKDPANMTALIDRIAERVPLITHDSDAPQSKRLCYIGVDNYEAGRMCGQLVREALPDGGVVVVQVGNLDQDNARLRRQGVIDELLGRTNDRTRFDAQDAVLKGDRYEIRATFTDDFDRQKSKAQAQDAMARWSDVACFVGLFEYEPPILVEAVTSAGKAGRVQVVAFDEADGTLQGILDGTVHGTVVQNPYEYGRKSMEVLSKLVREPDPDKRKALLPANGFIKVPARAITKANVQAFWDDLKSKLKPQ